MLFAASQPVTRAGSDRASMMTSDISAAWMNSVTMTRLVPYRRKTFGTYIFWPRSRRRIRRIADASYWKFSSCAVTSRSSSSAKSQRM